MPRCSAVYAVGAYLCVPGLPGSLRSPAASRTASGFRLRYGLSLPHPNTTYEGYCSLLEDSLSKQAQLVGCRVSTSSRGSSESDFEVGCTDENAGRQYSISPDVRILYMSRGMRSPGCAIV